jgi:GT2 family glycosyltransferase
MKVVFCLPGRQFSGNFLSKWSNLLTYCINTGIDVVMSQRYNPNVYYVRAQCLGADVLSGKNQKPFRGKINYDYIMWMDSDTIFEPIDFETLLRRQLDIVGGVYLMEDGMQYAVVKDWDLNYFRKYGTFKFLKKEDLASQQNPIEVSYTGFGFLLMKRGVIEKIEYPWFEPQITNLGNDVIDFASEDVSFCLKARAAGLKIHIDPTVRIGHEKTRILI